MFYVFGLRTSLCQPVIAFDFRRADTGDSGYDFCDVIIR